MQLPDFSRWRVLVAGDLMLDRYWSGAVQRISPEAPVPIVRVGSERDLPGGAGNVAVNLAALGVHVGLIGICGNDAAGDTLIRLLEEKSVKALMQRVDNSPTIMKLRVLSQHQQLIRLDFEDSRDKWDAVRIVDNFKNAIADADVVVLSDYGKGTLNQVSELIRIAREAGKPTLVDPKGTDFDRYAGAYLMTPNLSEFQAVVGECRTESDIVRTGLTLIGRLGLGALVVTRGEDGMTLMTAEGQALHLPAQAKEVFDVTGAGDTVISTLAAGLAAGIPLESVVMLANLAGGIVVAKLGAATVSPHELQLALQGQTVPHQGGVVNEADLLELVKLARLKGEKVVLTNGCFDILHAGHVEYLKQARALGDRLVVLVNSDESVRRLKGSDRPLNGWQDRMAVLAALDCVDWVCGFETDTPRETICRVQPDMLVKGGDYTDITKIAGHDCVLAAGGEVRLVGFKEGYSTSKVISAIQAKV
jgi:D-beta-D-heptose 7-phosphate kinase/D-beta-D-heptose 1-phosphate adenosyltransferase